MSQTLQALVRERRYKQGWVAEQLGVSNATVSRWLRGERRLPIIQVPNLAHLLDVPIDTVVHAAAHSRGPYETRARRQRVTREKPSPI